MAACSVVASDLPRWLAGSLALAACVQGLRLARQEANRIPREVVIGDGGAWVFVDSVRVERFEVRWRGPLACASWRDGSRTCRLVWWPDTLRRAARRELRLAAPAPAAARPAQSMAT